MYNIYIITYYFYQDRIDKTGFFLIFSIIFKFQNKNMLRIFWGSKIKKNLRISSLNWKYNILIKKYVSKKTSKLSSRSISSQPLDTYLHDFSITKTAVLHPHYQLCVLIPGGGHWIFRHLIWWGNRGGVLRTKCFWSIQMFLNGSSKPRLPKFSLQRQFQKDLTKRLILD